MSRRRVLTLFLALSAALAVLSTAHRPVDAQVLATTGTKRIAFAEREWLEVGLDVQGVTVDRLKLHLPGKVKGQPFLPCDHEEV